MILLDTNVLSELMKASPEPKVIAWLDSQPRASIWTTSVTILEIRFGLYLLPTGKRRDLILETFESMVKNKLERRVVPFDTEAAERAAILLSSRQKSGRSGELRDTMIAGIASATKAVLATRNTRHFEGLRFKVVNPWTDM